MQLLLGFRVFQHPASFRFQGLSTPICFKGSGRESGTGVGRRRRESRIRKGVSREKGRRELGKRIARCDFGVDTIEHEGSCVKGGYGATLFQDLVCRFHATGANLTLRVTLGYMLIFSACLDDNECNTGVIFWGG